MKHATQRRIAASVALLSALCLCSCVGLHSKPKDAFAGPWTVECTVAPVTHEKLQDHYKSFNIVQPSGSLEDPVYEICLIVRKASDRSPDGIIAARTILKSEGDAPSVVRFPGYFYGSGTVENNRARQREQNRQSGAFTCLVSRASGRLETTVTGELFLDGRSMWKDTLRVEVPEHYEMKYRSSGWETPMFCPPTNTTSSFYRLGELNVEASRSNQELLLQPPDGLWSEALPAQTVRVEVIDALPNQSAIGQTLIDDTRQPDR